MLLVAIRSSSMSLLREVCCSFLISSSGLFDCLFLKMQDNRMIWCSFDDPQSPECKRRLSSKSDRLASPSSKSTLHSSDKLSPHTCNSGPVIPGRKILARTSQSGRRLNSDEPSSPSVQNLSEDDLEMHQLEGLQNGITHVAGGKDDEVIPLLEFLSCLSLIWWNMPCLIWIAGFGVFFRLGLVCLWLLWLFRQSGVDVRKALRSVLNYSEIINFSTRFFSSTPYW